MAAEEAFKNVLKCVANSKLNFSIYQTPFSAQLSLKMSFANYSQKDDSVQLVETENKKVDVLQLKIKQLETKLQTSEIDNGHLLNIIQKNKEIIENLETKGKNLEVSLKSEKKKVKKERQKAEKEAFDIKADATDEEEFGQSISDIATFNKYDVLTKISDQSEIACTACETRNVSMNDLSVCTKLGFDIFATEKLDISVQTVHKDFKSVDTQTNDDEVFPHTCFYCEKDINSKKELASHSEMCHETLLNISSQVKHKCDKGSANLLHSSELKMHVKNERGICELTKKVVAFSKKDPEQPILFPQTSFPPPLFPPPQFPPTQFPPTHFPQPSFPPLYSFPPSTSCYTCGNGKLYNNKIELKKHYDESHRELILFWCEVCFTNYASERGLKSHRRNSHKNFS